MADEACEVRLAGNRERAYMNRYKSQFSHTEHSDQLHDVIVVNNNLSNLIRKDISYWFIATYHGNYEDRLLLKPSWYHRLSTFSSLPG